MPAHNKETRRGWQGKNRGKNNDERGTLNDELKKQLAFSSSFSVPTSAFYLPLPAVVNHALDMAF